ncbi:methylated-DNA--[protein]-cysteine S-methyltransferase [Salisediminibacterium selenitireducens]|uniref:Methylated-DNA--protein-cysteine methyltransferase n=1 Tax=Bacillus selenitireducens (strain ATCC 700615 / DSM 15326 / MLS10) TaxID=439292 RepID=D6XXM1_BACIE|nr:methylated-DNA--[protein]-cysteine S-methyltransferase [Salisediminibacterium selenitireducens]ADI00064.1 methylated-DNA/protein-cysteine methyltransferase [[Bacillus] selenitireducens MLS10]
MPKNSALMYSVMNSPLGDLTLVKSEKGLCYIEFGSSKDTICHVRRKLRTRQIRDELVWNEDELTAVKTQLEEYFNGERTSFDVALDMKGTPFQKLVWEKVNQIPYGKTKSYKDIAVEIGAPKAVRAIGGANNQNPVPLIIPCHRVIGSNGSLVGYGGGLDKKEKLLDLEGLKTVTKR